MSIKDTLFQLLFPLKTTASLRNHLKDADERLDLVITDLVKMEKEIMSLRKEKDIPKPTMADLMREDLGIMTVDFFNTKKSGDEPWKPPHYLYDEQDEPTKKAMISELSMIYSTTVFKRMIEYHINSQGNFTVRVADGEQQILAGRMTINGVSLIYQDVLAGYEAYQESRKPEEDFDKFDLNSEV